MSGMQALLEGDRLIIDNGDAQIWAPGWKSNF